jgi:hypothetical protein
MSFDEVTPSRLIESRLEHKAKADQIQNKNKLDEYFFRLAIGFLQSGFFY